MSVQLKLVSSEGPEARVAVEGDLRRADATHGVNPLESLLGDGWRGKRVVLDCRRVGYIDSAAIGWMLASAQQLRAGGGGLVLHSLAPRMSQMLDLVRFRTVVPIAADEADAVARLSAGNGSNAGATAAKPGKDGGEQ